MPSTSAASFHRCFAVGAPVITLWLIYHQTVAPLRERQGPLRSEFASLHERMDHANESIKKLQAKDAELASARVEVHRAEGDASSMVWMHDQLEEYFRRFGFSEFITRLNTSREEPEVPGYQRFFWAVGLPLQEASADLSRVLPAVAELEADLPAFKVIDFAMLPDAERPGRRVAVVTVAAVGRE